MSIVKFSAMISGLCGLSTAHSWIVTKKLGNWSRAVKGQDKPLKPSHSLPVFKPVTDVMEKAKKSAGTSKLSVFVGTFLRQKVCIKSNSFMHTCRMVYKRELGMAIFIFVASVYGILVEGRWDYSIFLFLQSVAFAMFGLNFVDSHRG